MTRWIRYCLAAPILLYGMYTYAATLFIRTTGIGIRKKVKDGKGIALTFDDGPNPCYTPKLLDLLAEYGIRTVFFVVGKQAEQHPEILLRMHEEGHSIGIHHYEHISAWKLTPMENREQIRRTAEVIERVTGQQPAFYRPPWGRFNMATPSISRPYTTVTWTHILGDWKIRTCEEALMERLRALPADGSIVVLHDDGGNPGADDEAPAHMLRVLEEYLPEATGNGICFLSPEEIIGNVQEQEYGR